MVPRTQNQTEIHSRSPCLNWTQPCYSGQTPLESPHHHSFTLTPNQGSSVAHLQDSSAQRHLTRTRLSRIHLLCHLSCHPSPASLHTHPPPPDIHPPQHHLPKCTLGPIASGLDPTTSCHCSQDNPCCSLLQNSLWALAPLPLSSPLPPLCLHQMLRPGCPCQPHRVHPASGSLLCCAFCLEHFISYLGRQPPSLQLRHPLGGFLSSPARVPPWGPPLYILITA